MRIEFRDIAPRGEGIFDEVAEIEDETESGTFLVCWETGTDLGGAVRAAGLCTCHEFAFRRALRWLFR